MIDLDTMPPNWKLAQNHAKASRPGNIQNSDNTDIINECCPCCLKPINKNQISLKNNSKQLEVLGFGFPLYFIFLKYCIILVLILIVTYSGMSLFQSVQQNWKFCSHRKLSASAQTQCTSFMIMFSEISTALLKSEQMLRIFSFFAHLLALLYIRDVIIKTMEYYDEKTTSLSDFSVLIKNLPLISKVQQKITLLLNDICSQKYVSPKNRPKIKLQKGQKVQEIILFPQLTKYYAQIQKKKALIQQKRKVFISFQENQKQIQSQNLSIENQICQIDGKINNNNCRTEQIELNFRQLFLEDNLQSQKAIVVMNTQELKRTVLQYCEANKLTIDVSRKYFGQNFQGAIIIQQAPEPSEIIWANINCSRKQKIIGNLIGWILSFTSLATVTTVFYFLVVLKTKNLINAIQHNKTIQTIHEDYHYILAVIIVYLSLIFIVLFNKFILGMAFHRFTQLQKHENTSDEEFSFAIKYTLGMFFTTALMTLAVEDITFHNFYSHEYGVIEEESIMFFINAFFVPLIWLINPEQIQVLITRKLHQNKSHFTQQEANRIMSDANYKMGKRYAEIIKTMWFTFLYAALIPFGAFVSLIGLAIYYWVDKYNLLRRSSIIQNISGKLAVKCMKLLDFTLFLRSIGALLFDYQLRGKLNYLEIIFSLVGLIYVILPMNKILNFFHQERFVQQQEYYEAVKDSFGQTYKKLNPIFVSKSSIGQFINLKKPHPFEQIGNSFQQILAQNNNEKTLQIPFHERKNQTSLPKLQMQSYLHQVLTNNIQKAVREQPINAEQIIQAKPKSINLKLKNIQDKENNKENSNSLNFKVENTTEVMVYNQINIQRRGLKNLQTNIISIR